MLPNFSLSLSNFRGLRRVRWDVPTGVSVLVGPNGSGKTTLLDVMELLRYAYELSLPEAISHHLIGGWGLRNRLAATDEPVAFEIQTGSVRWHLRLALAGDRFAGEALDRRSQETVHVGDVVLMQRDPLSDHLAFHGQDYTCDERLALRFVSDAPLGDPALVPLVALIRDYRFYRHQAFDLREDLLWHSSDSYVHPSGRNLFSLLRSWRDARANRHRWDFVMESLRAAFPDLFRDLEFDALGTTRPIGRIVTPHFDESVPFFAAPDGLRAALLFLTAVAGGQAGSVIAIDELETSLHPFAIRQLLGAFRDWCEDQKLSVLLATHSPVVLDDVGQNPARIFVMEPGQPVLPVQLAHLRNPEWLTHFSIGKLYTNLEFGAPRE